MPNNLNQFTLFPNAGYASQLELIEVLCRSWIIPKEMQDKLDCHFIRRWETSYWMGLPKVTDAHLKGTYFRYEGKLFKVITFSGVGDSSNVILSFRKSPKMPIGYVIVKPYLEA